MNQVSPNDGEKIKMAMVEFLYAAICDAGGQLTVTAKNLELAKKRSQVPGQLTLQTSKDGLTLTIP